MAGRAFIPLARTLYVVGLPIGNPRDITLRALDVLARVSTVFAEDVEPAIRLVSRALAWRRACEADADKPAPPRPRVESYSSRTADTAIPRLLSTLTSGGSAALICDAGTPTLSDPGAAAVAAARAGGFQVSPIPGASALTAALSISGAHVASGEGIGGALGLEGALVSALSSSPLVDGPCGFIFLGFPPRGGKPRRELFDSCVHNAALRTRVCVFFEAPHRLQSTLNELAAVCEAGACMRRTVVCRELTKTHEEVLAFPSVRSAADAVQRHPPRGEYVITLLPSTT